MIVCTGAVRSEENHLIWPGAVREIKINLKSYHVMRAYEVPYPIIST